MAYFAIVSLGLWLLPPHPYATSLGLADPRGNAVVRGGTIQPPASRSGRVLRGDYEPIDVLLVVHEASWPQSVNAIVEAVAGTTAVDVLIDSHASNDTYRQLASLGACVGFIDFSSDTPWVRDYGPLQVSTGSVASWVDANYSLTRLRDDALPPALAQWYGATSVSQEAATIEGGAVVANGRGLCVMTDLSLDESGIDLEDQQRLDGFLSNIGCTTLSVVPALDEEQTGHADVTVQFLAHDKVAIARMDARKHPHNARMLELTAQIVRESARRTGIDMTVVRVPMAAEGDVFYSYINGTRVGDRFLVPHYDRVSDEFERSAHSILAAHMPGVTLAAVPSDEMAELGGAVHCITLGIHAPGGRTPGCNGTAPALPVGAVASATLR